MLGSPVPGMYRGEFEVPYTDADATGAVRFTSLLKLVQSQAGGHTQSLGWDYQQRFQEGVFWVLSRMSFEVTRWPRWPASLTVDTWARTTRAVLALRDFRFGTPEGWCGRASTAWVLLKDRKPQRPEPWVKAYTQIQPEAPLADLPPALPPLDLSEAEEQAEALLRSTHNVHATWEDVDMNGHVGNVNSIGWCLDRHEVGFLMAHRPHRLDVNFLAEMFAGEKYTIASRPLGDLTFDYLVVRAEDQTPTLRLRMSFLPIAP